MSLVLDLIENNKNWESVCELKNIRIKRDGNIAMFNHDPGADFSDPLVCESTGIIIDVEKKRVVCQPFEEILDFFDKDAPDIDWSTARIQEKVDGCLIKYWYNAYRDSWQFSTRDYINVEDVDVGGLNMLTLIHSASNYVSLENTFFDETCTYLFELVSPLRKNVVAYGETELYFLTCFSNETGREIDSVERMRSAGFICPDIYTAKTLEQCVELAKSLNAGCSYPVREGFIVADGRGHRIKIKSPDHVIYQKLKTSGPDALSKKLVYNLVHSEDFDYRVLKMVVAPEILKVFEYYDSAIKDAELELATSMLEARESYNNGATEDEILAQYPDETVRHYVMLALEEQDVYVADLIATAGGSVLGLVKDYQGETK